MQNTTGKFYSSLGLLIVLNAIIKPLWILGIDRQVQNAVGPHEYGSYFSLFNLSVVCSFLLDWGLTTYFNRQLASQRENFIHHAGDFLLIKIFFAFLFAGVVVLAAYISGIDRWDIVWGVILIQIFTSLFVFFRSVITAEQWFRTEAWLSVLDKTLMIMLCGSLLFFPSVFGIMTINKFLWVQSACTALAMISAAVIVLRRGVSFAVSHTNPVLDKKFIANVLPYALIVLLMSVHYRVDGFLLERMHPGGAYEAGIYAGAYRLLDAANMAGVMFTSILLPYIARQWNAKETSVVILTIRHFLLTFAVAIASMAVFLGSWIQDLLYHHTDSYSVNVLQLCLPSLIGYCLVHIYGTVLTARGYIRSFCVITGIAVLVNLVLNLWLIPSMGAKGCCIAALVSQGICGITCMVYASIKMKTGLYPGSLLIYIFTGAVLSALFYWGNEWPVSKWGLIIAAAMMSLLILIATRLVKPGEWMASLKKSHL